MANNIKVARIDNRYVHGQVAARLIREFAITKVLVVSDLYAKDLFMSQLMKTMSFSGATIEVLTVADAVKLYNNGTFDNDNVMLLWGDVKSAHQTYTSGLKFTRMNIGNLPGGVGRKRVDKSNYIDANDAALLKELASQGIDVYFQNMPDLPTTSLPDALKLTGL